MKKLVLVAAALLAAQSGVFAQGRGGRGGGAAAPPQTPKASAPIDVTGYWVSIVTEDWRYRMVTPAKGDYQGVPMTPDARKIADAWDPAKEEASGDLCKSYGAPALLRVPGRLHITWQDDQTLRMDSDAGKQTRTFHFGNWKAPAGPHTIQGDSVAEWEGGGRGSTDGAMKATTTNLKAGFLRKNGVPYSENTTMTENFMRFSDGTDEWFTVGTIVEDPTYLNQSFITSSNFKREADGAKFKPVACRAS
jgi:hypothetical protein